MRGSCVCALCETERVRASAPVVERKNDNASMGECTFASAALLFCAQPKHSE